MCEAAQAEAERLREEPTFNHPNDETKWRELQAENERLRKTQTMLVETAKNRRAEIKRLRERDELTQRMWEATLAAVERLTAENTELRKAYESDEYAIEQASEVMRLRNRVNVLQAQLNDSAAGAQRLRDELKDRGGTRMEFRTCAHGIRAILCDPCTRALEQRVDTYYELRWNAMTEEQRAAEIASFAPPW
jgi:chromosome segregation ATPase